MGNGTNIATNKFPYTVYYKNTRFDLTWKKFNSFTNKTIAVSAAKSLVDRGAVEKTKVVKE
jgi:hypothetical protein